MIVVGETNFVLELALNQDKFRSCHHLVSLAEKKEIEFLLPAYSLIEPYETLIRRIRSRRRMREEIDREVKEIKRSAYFNKRAHRLAQLTELLLDVENVEQRRLDGTVAQLLEVVTVIELSGEVLKQANRYREGLRLSPQDAIILASVMSGLAVRNGPACFITRNRKDFAPAEIVRTLDQQGCKLMFDFEAGLDYVRNTLANGAAKKTMRGKPTSTSRPARRRS